MKKSDVILFLIFIIIRTNGYLTEHIQYLHPYPQPSHLEKIFCIDSMRAIVIGGSGIIIRTTDGGEQWSVLNSGTSIDLWSIYFSEPTTGWICGDNGTIFKSIDSGKTWIEIQTKLPRDISLNSIYFSKEKFGWTTGISSYFSNYKCVYAKTEDSGKSWIIIDTLNARRLISFISPSIGWSFSDGNLMKTIDSGITWFKQAAGFNFFFENYIKQYISIVDSNIGYLHTSDGILFKTIDGGYKWDTANSKFPSTSLFFLNEQNGFCGSIGIDSSVIPYRLCPAILQTTDGGKTYKRTTIREIDTSTVFISTHGSDFNHIISIGTTGAIVYTKDGGKTWGHNNVITRKSLYAVSFTDSMHGWAAGESQTVIRTTDGGKTWNKSIIKDMWGFPSLLFFFNHTHGYAFSYGSVRELWETYDAGDTWSKKSTLPFRGVTNGDCFDSNTIAITGDTTGCVVLSSNGGTIWNVVQVEQGTQKRITSVTYQNSNTLFATGLAGIYKSTDGGQNWSLNNTSGNISEFTCVRVLTNGYGYAATYHGEVYKTQDHGKTWIGLGTPFECDIAYLSVTDSQTCCFPALAYGIYGMAFYTLDGGKTWKKANYPAHTNFANGIFALGKTDWVIAHAFGGVSRLTLDTAVSDIKIENKTIKNNIIGFQLKYINKSLLISFNAQKYGKISVKLFNLSGKRVSSYSLLFSNNGLQEFSIPLKHCSKGAYLVSISRDNFKYNRRIMIF